MCQCFDRTPEIKKNTTSSKRRKRPNKGGDDVRSELGVLTEGDFTRVVRDALTNSFGELGSIQYPVDVISWDPSEGEGLLRADAR